MIPCASGPASRAAVLALDDHVLMPVGVGKLRAAATRPGRTLSVDTKTLAMRSGSSSLKSALERAEAVALIERDGQHPFAVPDDGGLVERARHARGGVAATRSGCSASGFSQTEPTRRPRPSNMSIDWSKMSQSRPSGSVQRLPTRTLRSIGRSWNGRRRRDAASTTFRRRRRWWRGRRTPWDCRRRRPSGPEPALRRALDADDHGVVALFIGILETRGRVDDRRFSPRSRNSPRQRRRSVGDQRRRRRRQTQTIARKCRERIMRGFP